MTDTSGMPMHLPLGEQAEAPVFTANARGKDGLWYAVYFSCTEVVDAEHIVEQLDLQLDLQGICIMVEVSDKELH